MSKKVEWPPIFIKCELCNFETMWEKCEIKKHLESEEHKKNENAEKRENTGWFWYFGKINDKK